MKLMKILLASLGFVAAASAAHATSVTYKIEPTHTFIYFEAKHFGTSTARGRWDKKDGEITIDRVAKTGRAQITIDMASIDTGVEPFNEHLKGKDFFNVAVNPKGFFVSDKFKFDGDKVTELTGELTFNGKSGPAATPLVTRHTVSPSGRPGAKARGSMNRPGRGATRRWWAWPRRAISNLWQTARATGCCTAISRTT